MSDEKTPEQHAEPIKVDSSLISKIFGPIRLLPGESEDVYNAGLLGTIKELGATTHLQTYLAEKIFQCLWWMRRYEIQKQAALVNGMVDLLTRHDTDKKRRTAITHNLQAQLWNDPQMLKIIEALGHTPESLAAKATSNTLEEIQKIDLLIALRAKTLTQLQQSYEALANRSVMQERLKMQNELLKRDLQAIDVPAVEKISSSKGESRGQRKAKSGK
jgi:hypothetical protein